MKISYYRIAIVLFLLLGCAFRTEAQTTKSFMVGDNIAAFYPANFDSVGTLPSLIFKNNLQRKGNVPVSWTIKPVFSIENGKNVVKISYSGAVDFYGNGEVAGPLRRNGTTVTMWNTDSPNYLVDNGTRLYQSHPWIMGVRADGTAFGIISDHTWKQTFSITNPVTITSDGPGFRVIIIERNSPQEMIKTLADLTGKIELPALWTLGFQQSRFTYVPASTVRTIADQFRNRKIPCDVIWMDIDYMDQYKVFTFDPAGFSDPKDLNDYLHSKNFKAVYMIDPGVKKQSGYFVYDQGTAGNHWVKKSDGTEFNGQVWPPVVSFPDFTKPSTRTWWSSLYNDFMAKGIDGVWNDMNEPSVFDTPDKTIPESSLHAGGGDLPAGTHARYHNVYGYLMVKASREGIASTNPGKRPFVLSRANFLGGQRYAATWTGDNLSWLPYLKLSIPMSITLGLSGQPISGADIGGFNFNCTADLLGQWMAIGVYYPFSRNHTISGSTAQEPWAYGPEIENVSRTAVNRRYRLLPYMYTLLREASQTGMPLMRPVFFADHTDLSLRNEQQAFMLGKDLLIVPRWASNPNLPKGDWDRVPFESTEDRYQANVYIRPGAVVPIGNVIQSTTEYKSDSLTLLVNPLESGLATGILYHDDGDGFGYQANNYALHEFSITKHNNDTLKVVISQIEGSKNVSRVYRTGLVTDNGIVYSTWSTSTIRYMAFLKDEKNTIDLNSINTMYVAGNFNPQHLPMKHIDEKKWKLDSLHLQSGKTYTVRFSQGNRNTGTRWGAATGISGVTSVITDTLSNIVFSVPANDYYSIAFDQSTQRYTIQKSPPISTLDIVGDATPPFNWYGLRMSQSTDDLNVFTWVGSLFTSNGSTEGKFKFHFETKNNCDDVWLYSAVPDQALSATSLVSAKACGVPDNKWKVQPGQNGTYKISVNVLTKKITIQKLLSSLSIVGDATVVGWNTTGLAMNQAPDRPNLFTWVGKLSASNGSTEGRFKFHSGTNGFCDDIWLYASTPDQSLSGTSLVMANDCSVADNKWKVKNGESGNYKIIVDTDTKTIKIQKLINTLAIVGDATSIGWDQKGISMRQSIDNENVFTWTGHLSASNGTTEGKFKFHAGTNGFCDDTWLYASTPDQSLSGTSFVMDNGCPGTDNKWKVQASESGNYTITVNIEARTIKIQKVITALSIVGDATSAGWNTTGLPMQQSLDNPAIFTWTGLLSASNGTSEGRFKFHSGVNGFCDDTWLYANSADQILSAPSFIMANGCTVADHKWKVNAGETGTYKITINLDAKTIRIQKVILPTLSIVGDATSIGWNPVGLPMQQSVENINVFTWTGTLSASTGTTDGTFKFHSGSNGFCDDMWLYGSTANQSLSATGFVMAAGCSVADNKWKVNAAETGTYKITIDLNAKTIKIKKIILSSLSIVGDATSAGWNPQGLLMRQSGENPNLFTWTGTLSASNGTTEGKFKFHAGFNGFCDDTWLYSATPDQTLSATSFVIGQGCSGADNKWKVRVGETGIYQVSVDVEAKSIQIKNIAAPDVIMATDGSSESIHVQVFPNPVEDELTVQIKGASRMYSRIVLYDLQGSKIWETQQWGNEASKEIKVPMSTLSAGTYILEVETKEGIVTKLILK